MKILNDRNIQSSVGADELSAFSHEIAKGIISGKMSMQEAIGRVMNELNCNESYAQACIESWVEKEPTYNGNIMTNSRKPLKSSFYVRCCDQNDNDVGFVTVDKKVSEDESKIKYFNTKEQAEDFAKQMYEIYKEDNEQYGIGYEFYVDSEITSSRRPVKSYDTSYGDEIDRIYERQLKRIKQLRRKGFTDDEIDNDEIFKQTQEDMRNVGKSVKSARYIATDTETGEVLGSADTYEEAVEQWGEDVTITDSEASEGNEQQSELFQSRKPIKSAIDGGWEVRSSDVPKALDLFVEYFGEEDALEQIAKAMSDATLEENIDWIAQQWGFAEEIENLDDAWDKYETAKEIMGESELFNNLTRAAGYDELAEDLAFIFRMNDFREWDKVSGYDNDEDEEYDNDEDDDLKERNSELWQMLEDAKNREVDWSEVAKDKYRNAGWNEEDIDKITNNRSFPVKTVKNILSGIWTEEQAANNISQKQNINVGYARQILSNWIEQYKPKLIKSGILNIAEDINTEFDIDGDLESWAEQYTNPSGKSNTVGGEIVRAAMQIIGRYNNDGDMIGRGYGNESVNPAARYIIEKAEMDVNEQIQVWLDHDERADDYSYEDFIQKFTTEIEQILRENPELFQKPNKDDYWSWKTDEDLNYGFDECYVSDGEGNDYWFRKYDDSWECESIELNPNRTYSEGDTISDGDEFIEEIDPTEEFGSFEAEGFVYEYAGEEFDDELGQYVSWQITKVIPQDPFCDEGDSFTFYELEPDSLSGYTLFDSNGNEIDERTFLANSLIKSNITAGDEVVIEIERHGKWEIVAQSDDERGWTLKGDSAPAIFDNKNEAKTSQLAKDLERAGYSPNKGNMRFKKYA